MRSALIFSFLAALPLAVLANPEPEAEPVGFEVSENSTSLLTRQTSSTACPKRGGIHIIAGPGTGGTGPNDYGYLSSTVLAIQRAIPGSNNFCLGPYAGSNGLYQTENAEHQARIHLNDFHKACPKVPIAFVGYSTGAIGSMNLLCGSSPAPPWKPTKAVKRYPNNVFVMTNYGDETRKKGMPYNRGTCSSHAPKYPRKTSKGCKAFWPHIRSWCDKEDGDCCAGGVMGGPAHFAYPKKYDGAVVKFVKAQLKLYRKFRKSHHGKGH